MTIPLEVCEESELECIKIQLANWKEKGHKEIAYKLMVKQVNELWNAVEQDEVDINDLHLRTGHPEEEILRNIADNMGVKLSGEKVHCAACIVAKSKREAFRKKAEDVPKQYLERIHGDAFGPLTVDTIDGSKYGFMFVDGKCDEYGRRRKWLKLTNDNTALTGYYAISEIIREMDSVYGRHMKILRTDNGGEFTSTMIDQLLAEKDIKRELTAADSPQENGIAEQGITTNYIQAICMMAQAGLMRSKPQLMGEALKHATYLNNKLLADEDPKNALAKIPVFGSVAWVNVPKEDRTKFDYKARLGVWVGVPSHHGRRSNNIYMLDTGKIAVSRHVEIWDGVMLSQLRQSEFNGKLPHLPIYDSPEEGDNIPVLVSFKKSGDRSVREYDIGEDGKSGEGKVEQKEDVKDHGGRLLRAKMVAYEFKNGYYVIKKAGDLRKRER